MYHPPAKDIIQKLKQNVVENISYGKYIINIFFENGNQLSFSAPFRFGKKDSISDSPINNFPIEELYLARILGCSIVDATCEEDGTLHVCFSNNDAIAIYANNEMYEAYTLLIDGQEYIV